MRWRAVQGKHPYAHLMRLNVGVFVSQSQAQELSPGGFTPDGLKHAVEPGAQETLCQKAGHTPAGVLRGGHLREGAESFPPESGACSWCCAELGDS